MTQIELEDEVAKAVETAARQTGQSVSDYVASLLLTARQTLTPEQSARADAAAESLKQMRGIVKGASLDEVLQWTHEGHRY
ncbi:MAG: hypothetical protein ACFCVE_05945 [Phycisphaerae bacterium]